MLRWEMGLWKNTTGNVTTKEPVTLLVHFTTMPEGYTLISQFRRDTPTWWALLISAIQGRQCRYGYSTSISIRQIVEHHDCLGQLRDFSGAPAFSLLNFWRIRGSWFVNKTLPLTLVQLESIQRWSTRVQKPQQIKTRQKFLQQCVPEGFLLWYDGASCKQTKQHS